MKAKFAWYLEVGPEQAKDAWNKGILTVDANVLLDLYRYHTATCESIITALEGFKGRVWISYQAAHEFFRNRKRVIASSEKTFRDALAGLSELGDSVDEGMTKLRSFRLLPRAELDALSDSLRGSVEKAREQIDDSRAKYPDYLRDDPILSRILKLFEGRVGDAPDAEQLEKLTKVAEQRQKAAVPPGFLDRDKDGDKKYGDYFLWSQIMEYAKATQLPIILVTSERKEDWWEKSSGKTLGPRLELQEEFHLLTGQSIFLYQTENFLKYSAEHSGTAVAQDVVQEIRELNAFRARQRYHHEPAVSVEQLPYISEEEESAGLLDIDLLREVPMMTGSGRFKPSMRCIPHIDVRTVSVPDGCPELNITTGVGTTFDFNVHIRSADRAQLLPVGSYIIEYVAVCDDEETLNNAVDSDTIIAGDEGSTESS